MHRSILLGVVTGIGLVAAACDRDRRGEIREEPAASAEERSEVREELRGDIRDIHERIRALPPDERARLHEELHRDMHREMHRDSSHGHTPDHTPSRPNPPPTP
jgi:hypothetical protein